jgi:hypothetical protein
MFQKSFAGRHSEFLFAETDFPFGRLPRLSYALLNGGTPGLPYDH